MSFRVLGCLWVCRPGGCDVVHPRARRGPLEEGGRDPARALTVDEVHRWLSILDESEYAGRKDLAELVRFRA
jgi:hypothetical protein